jgi:hypothetical protein
MRRKWLWIFGAAAVVVLTPAILVRMRTVSAEAALQNQYRLAHAEGIPTNAAEFQATIRPCLPSENAAPIYRKLKEFPYPPNLSELRLHVQYHPSATNLQQAQKLLADNARFLGVADRAAALTRCWFDRDWSPGAATLMPEYAWMKSAARLVSLRGSVAANRGDVLAALASTDELDRIAAHAAEEGTQISALVSDSIRIMAISDLANWALGHPDEPRYRTLLRREITSFPRPDLRREHSDELFSLMSVLELSTTPEGRANLGMRSTDVSGFEKIAPILLNRPEARVKIVADYRRYWATFGPNKVDVKKARVAYADMSMAMLAFPTGADVYQKLTDTDTNDPLMARLNDWQAKKTMYLALLEALGGSGKPPKSMDTSGFLSPYDDKPIRYRFDGKHITIEVPDGKDTPTSLQVPHD